MGKQVVLVVKNLLTNMGDAIDAGSIPGLGRSPGGGNDNSLQCSCMKIPRTEEPDRLWECKELDMTEQLSTYTHTRKQRWFNEANLGSPLPCNSRSKLTRLPLSTLQSFPSLYKPQRARTDWERRVLGEDGRRQGTASVQGRRCALVALLPPLFNASSIFFLSLQDT